MGTSSSYLTKPPDADPADPFNPADPVDPLVVVDPLEPLQLRGQIKTVLYRFPFWEMAGPTFVHFLKMCLL
jgi:hypothetical protein